MRQLVFTIGVMLLTCTMYGQLSTWEKPISFSRADVPALKKNAKTVKSFDTLDMQKIEREDAETRGKGGQIRFGYPHEVNYNLENSGEWTVLSNGDRIWRLLISCEGATSINLLYDKFYLPDSSKLFIYSKDGKQSMGAFTSLNNKGDKNNPRGFATGLIFSDQLILEYHLPKEVKDTGVISISSVIHGYLFSHGSWLDSLDYIGSVIFDPCRNKNINCPEGQNWQNEKNAVAFILVGEHIWCSGSLVNNTKNDYRPLFLTADHCISCFNYNAGSRLDNWLFCWRYESPTCVNDYAKSILYTSGATVLAKNKTDVDFALLELQEDPQYLRNGYTPYYLGWDRSGKEEGYNGGVGIHHPAGSAKKITPAYQIIDEYSSINLYTNKDDPGGNYTRYEPNTLWRVYFSNGATYGCSSGSPLLNSEHRLIGQLAGGEDECGEQSWYGKINASWDNRDCGFPDIPGSLKYWLDPLGTNAINPAAIKL